METLESRAKGNQRAIRTIMTMLRQKVRHGIALSGHKPFAEYFLPLR